MRAPAEPATPCASTSSAGARWSWSLVSNRRPRPRGSRPASSRAKPCRDTAASSSRDPEDRGEREVHRLAALDRERAEADAAGHGRTHAEVGDVAVLADLQVEPVLEG